jgi:hypothetical protein
MWSCHQLPRMSRQPSRLLLADLRAIYAFDEDFRALHRLNPWNGIAQVDVPGRRDTQQDWPASNRSISLEHWNMRERSTVEVFITFLKLACTSFGGPIAHLARDRSDDFRVGGAHQNHARPEFFDPSVRE